MNSKKGLGYLSLAATSILWGTTWIASKFGVGEMSGLQLSGMRQLIAGTIIVSYYLVIRKEPFPDRRQFLQLLIMSLFIFTIANSVSTWSLQYISTGLGALVGALYPLFVVLLERYVFDKKKILPLTLFGFFLGMLGIGIVFYDNLLASDFRSFVIGFSMSVVATLSWSFGTVLIARNEVKMLPFYSLGWQMLLSSVIVTLIGRATQPVIPLESIPANGWFSLAYLIVIGSIITFSAFIYSIKVLPHSVASLFAYINPLVALYLGSMLLGEKLTGHIVLGSVVTLFGVFIVNLSARKL